MFKQSTYLLAALAMFALAGCGQPAAPADEAVGEPTAAVEQPAAAPTEAAAPTVAAEPTVAGPAGMSGADFVAQAMSLKGSTVTLAKCSLLMQEQSDGTMACRVIDENESDVKDASGLPVDVFFKSGDLGAAAKDFLAAECQDAFCMVRLTGTLDVAEGTNYTSMTDVVFAQP